MTKQKRGRAYDIEARAGAHGRAAQRGRSIGPTPQQTGTRGDPQDRGMDNPSLAAETGRDLATDELETGWGGEPEVGQDIDGGLSAQPKANLTGGFDPGSERLVPALAQGGPGGTEGTDPGASSMSVVSDLDAPLDEQAGVRDATVYETGEAPMVWAERGNLPLPEELEPTPDETRGRRPVGTAEMGIDQRPLAQRPARKHGR